jgi:hypothetical protein
MSEYVIRLTGGDLEAAREVMQDGIEWIVGDIAGGLSDLAVLGTLQARAEIWVCMGTPAWHPDQYATKDAGCLTASEARVLAAAAEELEERAADSLADYLKCEPDREDRIAYHSGLLEACRRVRRALEEAALRPR